MVKISVVIPCRNEVDYINQTLDSLLNQTLNKNEYEIIVVDGMSTDGTMQILHSYIIKHPNVKLIENPQKNTPVAMNLGIKNSTGEIIVICGAHSFYAETFLEKGLFLLNKYPEYDCVGGPIISQGKNHFSQATALAMSSLIGVGNAKHRFPDYEGLAEMACFPFYRNSVFTRIGYYNEELLKNQDDEFSLRLRMSGGKVFISPQIKNTYFVRSNPSALFKQYFNYGVWRWNVIRMYHLPISFRQLVPSLFIILITVLLLIIPFCNIVWPSIVIFAVYSLSVSTFAFNIFFTKGFRIGINFIFAVLILHFSYGSGLLYSILRKSFHKIFN